MHAANRSPKPTALEDLLGVTPESVYDERLYRSLDRLLPHKEAIEAHLVQRFGELFDLDYDLLLYDVTSTYFEGVADAEIAKRGYSRDHRPDCVQVNIALVVTREGMPLGYEIFPGNITDVTTVQKIVTGMEARFGKANRVWVMDRDGKSGERGVAERDGAALRDRHTEGGTQALGERDRGQRHLETYPGRCRGEGVSRP